ncbi:MAG TPA: FHA domain-containing protein [Gammaproteobacteria bacterium]
MFDFILNKPIELKVGDQILKFSTLADYEFCMSGRTAIPSSKITDLVKFSTEQLKKEARTIKDIEKRFVSILSKSIEDPASINRALRELDPLIFSQDHSWRDIISGLNNGDDALNPYRRIALVKYMQYLSSRQEIIKYLYNEKKQNYKVGADTYSGMSESAEFKETLLLDNTVFEPGAQDLTKENAFERMPKGEAITIILAPTEEIDILLSKHKCKLAAQNGIQFIDQAGRVYKLNKGRNLIGRDSVSNIMIEPSLRDVSRLHLVIENFGDNTMQLTDLSSHGTYLSSKYLTSRTGGQTSKS